MFNRDMALTQRDLFQIEELIDRKLDEKFDEKFKFLPSKDEFFNAMDKVMGELKAIRENNTILTHQVSDHEERIDKIEGVVGIGA